MIRALALAALAGPAAAQSSLTPEEFLARLGTGTQRLTDAETGAHRGTEEFLSGARSLYAHSDGTCVAGRLEVDGAAICFVYPALDGTVFGARHCFWPFERDGALHVRSSTVPGDVQRLTPVPGAVECDGRPTA